MSSDDQAGYTLHTQARRHQRRRLVLLIGAIATFAQHVEKVLKGVGEQFVGVAVIKEDGHARLPSLRCRREVETGQCNASVRPTGLEKTCLQPNTSTIQVLSFVARATHPAVAAHPPVRIEQDARMRVTALRFNS